MIDNKTAHLALPLPDLSNEQTEDVPRIMQAFAMVDAHARKADAALEAQGGNVQTLEIGVQKQVARLDTLELAHEHEAADRAAADRAAAAQIDALAEAHDAVVHLVGSVEQKVTQQNVELDEVKTSIDQQGGRLDDAEVALASKANADLSNVAGNAISKYFHAQDVRGSGVNGGTNAAYSWFTRELNTIKANTIGATLSGSRITLPAGKYYIEASVPSFGAGRMRGALYNVTNPAYLAFGTTEATDYSSNTSVRSWIACEVSIDAAAQVELRMCAETTRANVGCGLPTSFGTVEIYSEIRIWKL